MLWPGAWPVPGPGGGQEAGLAGAGDGSTCKRFASGVAPGPRADVGARRLDALPGVPAASLRQGASNPRPSPRRRAARRRRCRSGIARRPLNGLGDSTRTVDVRVASLRKKIEDDPENPRRIRTVFGEGYEFVPS